MVRRNRKIVYYSSRLNYFVRSKSKAKAIVRSKSLPIGPVEENHSSCATVSKSLPIGTVEENHSSCAARARASCSCGKGSTATSISK